MPDIYTQILQCDRAPNEVLIQLQAETERRFETADLALFWQKISPIKSGLDRQYELLLRQRNAIGQYESAYNLILTLEDQGDLCGNGNSAIAVIDRIIIQKAIGYLAKDLNIERLWVNVSGLSISLNGRLASFIIRSLSNDGVDPKRLGVEGTERFCLDNQPVAQSFFDVLAAAGVPYALDDFGAIAGQFSSESITQFKPSLVKLDRAIVKGLADPSKLLQAKSFIKFVHAQGAEVLAECVETPDQFRLCRSLDIDYIQGRYLSKEVPVGDRSEDPPPF